MRSARLYYQTVYAEKFPGYLTGPEFVERAGRGWKAVIIGYTGRGANEMPWTGTGKGRSVREALRRARAHLRRQMIEVEALPCRLRQARPAWRRTPWRRSRKQKTAGARQ